MKYIYAPSEYRKLQTSYYELEKISFNPDDSKKYVLEKLEERSLNKRIIADKANTVIREYIETFENNPTSLTQADATLLEELYNSLVDPKTKREYDSAIMVRISKILKNYYKSNNNIHDYIRTLCNCVVDERILLYNHSDMYAKSSFVNECMEMLEHLDELSKDERKTFYVALYWLHLNHDDEDEETIHPVDELLAIDNYLLEHITLKDDALKEVLQAIDVPRNSLNEILSYFLWMNRHKKKIDIERFRPAIERYESILRKQLETTYLEKTSIKLSIESALYHADYHLGKISFEELLDGITRLQETSDDESPFIQVTRLAKFNYHYLTFLYRFSGYSQDKIIEMSQKRIKETLPKILKITKAYDNQSFNLYLLFFILGASYTSRFEEFSDMILDMTVYSDKALFVHTEMVKQLSLVLFDYLIKEKPDTLNGVAGHDTKYICDNQEEMRKLLEECCMFHDVGKFFMLDIVGNSMRKLTDEEFLIIKSHPANFEEFSRNWINQDERLHCIHDCALTHHLWHDETNGYPHISHTKNRPFSDILSIADSIDAATDIYGRPYRDSKTLDELIEEFKAGAGTRYGEDVVQCLSNQDVQNKLQELITNGRKDIYYKVYVFNKI